MVDFKLVVPRKDFMDAFAAKRGFDPLLHTNWFNISSVDVRKEKVGLYELVQAMMFSSPQMLIFLGRSRNTEEIWKFNY